MASSGGRGRARAGSSCGGQTGQTGRGGGGGVPRAPAAFFSFHSPSPRTSSGSNMMMVPAITRKITGPISMGRMSEAGASPPTDALSTSSSRTLTAAMPV
ncbi:hypothetical protein Z951_24405 [Streptomyces sp. PRh5]|nr:hypothetical protein Z951_24405 [Streptomyces sp. PRh5]